jgi:hypothetical protein
MATRPVRQDMGVRMGWRLSSLRCAGTPPSIIGVAIPCRQGRPSAGAARRSWILVTWSIRRPPRNLRPAPGDSPDAGPLERLPRGTAFPAVSAGLGRAPAPGARPSRPRVQVPWAGSPYHAGAASSRPGSAGRSPGRPGRAIPVGTLPVAPSTVRHRRGPRDPLILWPYYVLCGVICHFSS